jgi:hypothetical protein
VFVYADDVVVFIKPTKHDLLVIKDILTIFSEASELAINMDKTQFFQLDVNQQILPFCTNIIIPSPSFPIPTLGSPCT